MIIGEKSDKKIYVIHHADQDGYASAYAAYLKFGDNAKYIYRVAYGDSFPNIELDKNTEIYILDFSYPRNLLIDLERKVGKLVVIDHHETAANELEGLYFCIFDIRKSGCMLSWEYFHDAQYPPFIKYVNDFDLWVHQYKESRPFNLGLKFSEMSDFKLWDSLQHSEKIEEMISYGESIQTLVDFNCAKFLKYGVYCCNLFDKKIVLMNNGIFISQYGDFINKHFDVDGVAFFFITNQGDYVFSLRGKNKPDVHMGKLCKQYGGGGHADAAGFKLSGSEGAILIENLYRNIEKIHA